MKDELKKELLKKERENDRKETEKMMKAINENCKKAQKRELEERIQQRWEEIKQNKNHQIITGFVVVVLVIIGASVLALASKQDQEAHDICIQRGNTEAYCENLIK